MSTMTTTELVNKLFSFCEAYSGVRLFAYQAQFGKRIIRSILENDGEEITALFSRQCVYHNSLVTLADGRKKPIKDVKIGDRIKCFDFNRVVNRKVINSYSTGKKPIYELRLVSGKRIKCTLNHRLLDANLALFKPLSDFEAGDLVCYLDTDTNTVEKSRIRLIKYIGDRRTWDIEVEGVENFICNDVLVHNSGKSETVATISGGLALVLPALANLPAFVTDKRFDGFKDGFMIGIFAPSQRQAQIVFKRIKKRMGSMHCQQIMEDPEFNVNFEVSNGENVMLSNGSLICCKSASDGANIEGDSYMMIIVDEAQDVGNFKYSKSISPMGAFYNATKILIGTATTQRGFFLDSIERNQKEYENGGKRNHFQFDYTTVIKYNPKYEKYVKGEMKRIGENSDEFQMAYNLKWILQRGMFVSSTLFDELADPTRGLSILDTKKVHVAGIDLGKKNDSTVVTILEVDWDNPIIVKANGADEDDFIRYNVCIKAWLELQGDDWDEQYYLIKDFLNNFNVCKVVMDGTGVGDAIYDRLKRSPDYVVEPFVFSRQGKSELYKNLNSEIRAKRVHYPFDNEVKETREFEKFQIQMLDLEKSYSGQLLVVAHPEATGAHDDYPDSLALAVWGARGEPVSKPVTTNMPRQDIRDIRIIQGVNRFTARRRR